MKHERIVMLNDQHVPFHDVDTIKAVNHGLKHMKPNRVILGGDVVDFYSISRFDKDPLRRLHLDVEVSAVEHYLADLRKAVPEAKIVYLPGNHEDRLQRYIHVHAPELAWVDELKLPGLLHLEDFDIDWHPSRWYPYRGVIYSHLDRANKYGGYTAKNVGLDVGQSLVHGHSHKTGHVRIGERDFYDNGCLCQAEMEYMAASGPTAWSQAFMVVDYIGGKPYFTQVPIKNHQYVYDGRLFTPNGVGNLRTKKVKK